jgi:hypothetical protein
MQLWALRQPWIGHGYIYQFTLLQVDANAFFVDYGKVALNLNYKQAVSDLRVAATYVIK